MDRIYHTQNVESPKLYVNMNMYRENNFKTFKLIFDPVSLTLAEEFLVESSPLDALFAYFLRQFIRRQLVLGILNKPTRRDVLPHPFP